MKLHIRLRTRKLLAQMILKTVEKAVGMVESGKVDAPLKDMEELEEIRCITAWDLEEINKKLLD